MSVNLKLTERYQKILKATVQHYIATAEPVGSKTLAKEYDFTVSSATIRNALGQLEKVGLLYQPHTSAGRIPSDSGYRIYVDRLLTHDVKVRQRLDKQLGKQLKSDNRSFDGLLQRAAQILSSLSGYIAVITLPQAASSQLRHLQIVPISEQQAMLIVVNDAFQTQSIPIELPPSSQEQKDHELDEELQILSNFLNSKLRGLSLLEITQLDWQEVGREFIEYTDLLIGLLEQLKRCLQPLNAPQVIVHGLSEMIRLPEFSELEQVQTLLHLIEEEQEQLLSLGLGLPEMMPISQPVTIKIGRENPLASMHPCSLVSATYCQGNMPAGSVGVIGPTRMLYQQAIPLVESTANYLSEVLS